MVFDDSLQSPFYTRGSFLQLLTANRDQQMLVVMTAGIDGFSLINEAYGVDEADCGGEFGV